MKTLFQLYRALLIAAAAPVMLAGLLRLSRVGGRRFGWWKKIGLILRMIRNNVRITTASNFLEHLVMAERILACPTDLEGCVVECGSYKGGSAANLSLVCGIAGRELEIFDSFAGLPPPEAGSEENLVLAREEVHVYAEGDFEGSLEEVQGNIRRFGDIDRCRFNQGFFEQSLPGFDRPCVLAFVDVDLRDSLETCLRHLWPLLADGCALFTHEAPHMEIAALFFDREWWRENLGCEPPGLVGAGSGLGLVPDRGGFRSALGYTIKNPRAGELTSVPQGTAPRPTPPPVPES